jgi:sugar phosphate isomerase/epimerase
MKPHVHVPFDSLDKYLPFIKKEKLNLEIYFGAKSVDTITKEDIDDLKRKLDYNPGLSIHAPFMDLSPGAVDVKVREVTMQRFSDMLDISRKLNPEVVVFHSGYDRWKYDNRTDIWLEGSLETWQPINKKAEEMGIKIAIENIFEDEPGNLRLLCSEINSPNFGTCFDTGHFNLFSKLPLAEWIGIIKPYIKELHLHDNSRYGDDHLAIGDGDFDFRTLFSEVKGADCVYTIESHTVNDVKKSLERIGEYLK